MYTPRKELPEIVKLLRLCPVSQVAARRLVRLNVLNEPLTNLAGCSILSVRLRHYLLRPTTHPDPLLTQTHYLLTQTHYLLTQTHNSPH